MTSLQPLIDYASRGLVFALGATLVRNSGDAGNVGGDTPSSSTDFFNGQLHYWGGGGRSGSPLHVSPNFHGTLVHDLNPHLLVTVTVVLSPSEGVYLSFTNGILNGLTVTGEQVVNNLSSVNPESITVIDFTGPEAGVDSYALSLWRSIYIPRELEMTRLMARVKGASREPLAKAP